MAERGTCWRLQRPANGRLATCFGALVIAALFGCGEEGQGADASEVAEKHVRSEYVRAIKRSPQARESVEDGGGYGEVMILCGSRNQPSGQYACTATWGYADAMKQEWRVRVEGETVTSADLRSSEVESYDPLDALEP